MNDYDPTMRFYKQPAGAFCSGVLVSERIVLTAGHCTVLCKGEKDKTRFVFGFNFAAKDIPPTSVSSDDVYECVDYTGYVRGPKGDWLLIMLDRKVSGRTPIKLEKVPELKIGEEIFTIGHPHGLPAKVAANAQVRHKDGVYYKANLDTFSGNSGGPIFNGQGGLVGILSSGTSGDYEVILTREGYKGRPWVNPDTIAEGPKTGFYAKFTGITEEMVDIYEKSISRMPQEKRQLMARSGPPLDRLSERMASMAINLGHPRTESVVFLP